ncbi:hypothetical protein DS884_15045 [Tenacibaculum sp. E3R01]|uniref:hypothetical protein n=1 Tax=unclassified Tenacibaculum TaxID=2635139 RepID=UPI000B816C5F|nr:MULTISPECIES: hypothetical protein [unclassified Tenacibaculum]RBW55888.1 hypothetical protein DS884_15045 [Tenacibaculum sp. E3R01]
MESKYKAGDVVYAKARPFVMLVIRIYARKIYYCRVQNDLLAKELVYFERELELSQNLTTES